VNEQEVAKFGEVAVIGRPNVGKSTLLNALVGEHVSITSAKPHTTRHRILGILNRGIHQAVFVDTPGHERTTRRAIHRLMARVVHQALETCDVVLLVVEATGLTTADRHLIELLEGRLERTILVLNKVDKVKLRKDILPLLQELGELPFAALVPVSAQRGTSLDRLVDEIVRALPAGGAMYPLEMVTDRSEAFRVAEIIREKLFDALYEEVPYGLTVEVEHIGRHEDGRRVVHALIWLERESHKPIVIGRHGQQLKEVGTLARAAINEMLGENVHLELWVKVREHWSDNEAELRRLGFET
jgi:GTP-binding protein Era